MLDTEIINCVDFSFILLFFLFWRMRYNYFPFLFLPIRNAPLIENIFVKIMFLLLDLTNVITLLSSLVQISDTDF